MMNLKRFLPLFVLVCIVFGAHPAYAANELVLNPGGDRLFNERSMAPGESVTKELKASNKSKDRADIFLNVENVRGNRLADVLDFTLTDQDTGEYLIGGPGDEFTLKEIGDEGNVFIERLKGKGSNTYLITLTFDVNAGNRYQSLSTKFDLSFRLTANPARPGSDPPHRPHRGGHDHGTDDWDTSQNGNGHGWDRDGFLRGVSETYHRFASFCSGIYSRSAHAFTGR